MARLRNGERGEILFLNPFFSSDLLKPHLPLIFAEL